MSGTNHPDRPDRQHIVVEEEIHLRRVRSVTAHSEIVEVREQHVSVTRAALDD